MKADGATQLITFILEISTAKAACYWSNLKSKLHPSSIQGEKFADFIQSCIGI